MDRSPSQCLTSAERYFCDGIAVCSIGAMGMLSIDFIDSGLQIK